MKLFLATFGDKWLIDLILKQTNSHGSADSRPISENTDTQFFLCISEYLIFSNFDNEEGVGKKMRPKGRSSSLRLGFMRGLVWAGPVYLCTL